MMNSKKRIYFMAAALFVAGILILLTIIDSSIPEAKKQEVILRADTKDITIDDMMKNLDSKKNPSVAGRWDVYGEEMVKFLDRHNREYCLGPTHEELVTTLTHKIGRAHV